MLSIRMSPDAIARVLRLCAVFHRQHEVNRGSAANRADGPNSGRCALQRSPADGECECYNVTTALLNGVLTRARERNAEEAGRAS
jgi:hypothetical protein